MSAASDHLCPLDHGSDDEGHALGCLICARPLRQDETRCCNRCINGALLDLTDIEHAYATLPNVVESSGYRMHAMPGGDALVMYVDGSVEGGGPDDWISDPTPVLAVLESNERDWRHTFGHPPAEDLATVVGSVAYLRRWMGLAARTHDAFDDYVREIRTLKARLEHVAGLADDPRRDPVPCACGGQLQQEYAGYATSPVGRRGLTEDRSCRSCDRVYEPDQYAFHLRLLTDTPGWVSVAQAARVLDRPVVTIKAWVAALDLPSVCNRVTRRLLVHEERARELHEERPARKRAG